MPTNDLLNASDFLETGNATQAEQDLAGGVTPQPEEFSAFNNVDDFDDDVVDTYSPSDSLPDSLKIAGFDTGIPLNKKFSSWLVGTGDGLTDSWHGIEQLFGNEEIKRGLQGQKDAMNDLYNDPRYGNVARTGQVGGFVADPAGVIIPLGKGKNLFDVAKVGMATGTVFGGIGYVDEEAGQSRAGNALLGTITGGILSPTLFGVSRAAKGAGGKLQERAALTALNQYKKQFNKYIAAGKSPTQATHFAMKKMGMSNQDKAGLIMASRRPFNIGGETDEMGRTTYSAVQAQQNVDAMSNRTITKATDWLASKSVGRDVISAAKSMKQGFVKAVVPISTRIAAKDQELAKNLVAMEAKVHSGQFKLHERVKGFTDEIRGFENETAAKLQLYLANGKVFKAKKLYLGAGGSKKNFEEVQSVISGLLTDARKAGYKLPEIKEFFPRRVRDVEGLAMNEHAKLGAEIKHFIATKMRNPSDKEIDKLVRGILNPSKKTNAKTGGSLRSRQKERVNAEELKYYHDTGETLMSYVNDMVTDIERAKFLTNIGAKKPPKGFALDGTDLDDNLNGVLAQRQKSGYYHAGDLQELTGLLKSRFGQGEVASSAAVQAFKNSTYIATLGNFKSAVTQIGDLAFSAHRNGIINTSLELMNRIPGLRRVVKDSHKRVTKEQIGLEDAIQEFAGDGNGKKALAHVLKWTQFSRMDKLGKETFVNSHFRKVKKALNGTNGKVERMAMRRKWQPVFGDQTEQMIDDLSKGKFSDNVAVYLFDSLSEVQPIALSEMPQAYLDNPNGRIFYMLRSFTIKQLDLMRRDILDNFAKGDAPKAFRNVASLGTLFVMANGSADMAKDFISGKDVEMEDTIVDNIWKLMGVNRYTGDRVLSGTPGQAVTDMLAPPFSVWDRAIRSAGDPQKMWEASPFNGLQIFDEMFNSGELTQSKTNNYYRQLGKFHDSNDN